MQLIEKQDYDEKLVEYVNQKDYDGNTPLFYAVINGMCYNL